MSFSSIQGTLTSIRTILHNRQMNNSHYALLRKYYDSAIIMIYFSLYLEEHSTIENLIVRQIDNWLQGKAHLPKFRVMSDYISGSPELAPITDLLFVDDRYRRLRVRCNDHTHYNFYYNVLLNDSEIHLPNRHEALNQFVDDMRDLVILHLSCLFFTKQHYMASSDYVDSLDCGLNPEPESQYWVARFVQEVFDAVVAKHRPDAATVIKDHTDMHLK